MARHQQVVRVDRERLGDVDADVAGRLAASVRDRLPSCASVALEDYNKGVLVPSVIGAVLGVAPESGIPSIVDPKRQRFFDYRGVTVFKPGASP